jgi:hypothetical protein
VLALSLAAPGCSNGSKPATGPRDAGFDATTWNPSWVPGDGGVCTAPVGSFPSVSCDPSDEQAQGCQGGIDSGCAYSPLCGDLTTCQPFIKNPAPGAGTGTFRMRLVNITSPPVLLTDGMQWLIITPSVDLPASQDAGGAPCGEDGWGDLNWLLSIDKDAGTVVTGGAPPSADPFGTGYCYMNAAVGGSEVTSVSLQATWTGNTFGTSPGTAKLNVPIFLATGGAVLLPVRGPTFHDVTVSDDGDCIGAINPGASFPPPHSAVCQDQSPAGPESCARWHAGGTFAGYITLEDAEAVFVSGGDESLCVVLLGRAWANDAGGPSDAAQAPEARCRAGAFTQGDYSSSRHVACDGGDDCDSMWMSVQFAASAVKITDGDGVSLCHGGTVAMPDGG